MSWVSDFRAKGFVEQVKELTDISRESRITALADLFSLYKSPLNDKPVDAMVEHTLRDLLNGCEAETVEKICSGNDKEKKLCIHIAQVQKFPAAIPALVELAAKEKNLAILQTAFVAMSELKDPSFLPTFRANLHHVDEVIAGVAIGMIGELNDVQSVDALMKIVDDAEGSRNYKICSLETGKAVESLTVLGGREVQAYMVTKLHHKNPTARRMLHEALEAFADEVVPLLGDVFGTESIDMQIMAANILGRIGGRNAGNFLVAALEREGAEHPNVRFAIYEALGFVRSSKGLVALMDALNDDDDLVLRAVVYSLDMQFNPMMVSNLKEHLEPAVPYRSRLLKTIIDVRALAVFEALYTDGDPSARDLIQVLSRCKDIETVVAFKEKLDAIPGSRAQSDLLELADIKVISSCKKKGHVLAVDDSSSMLSFYRTICTTLDLDITTALNGKLAWDKLESGDASFDVMIVDMNMPVMDGIELTQKVRASGMWDKIPIIMGTTESDKAQVRLAKQAGVDDFIVKPIQPDVLAKKLGKILKL